MLLNNKYVVLENIASGEFGALVKVQYNNTNYAIKIGSKEAIKYEAMLYKELKGVANISKVYDLFEFNTNYCMVLDYYSNTLNSVKEETFSTSPSYIISVLNYIKELIYILRDVHAKHIIHRDIKPSNVCLANNKVFLIDFGISKIYKIGRLHNSESKISGLVGSVNFSSLNIINCIEPSRRDDIESTIYVLLYMLLSNTSYNEYNNLETTQKKDGTLIIGLLKTNYSNIIDYELFNKLFNYIRRLKYNQQPNYDYIITLLCSLIK
jgi:serine/threonine protein kinase